MSNVIKKVHDRLSLYFFHRKILKKYSYFQSHSKPIESKLLKPWPIWVCWLQGIDNAPEIVKLCYHRLTTLYFNDPDVQIITLDETNFCDYVSMPEDILNLYKSGKMTATSFSDLLRLELLIQHGGTWIDATCYLTEKIPQYIMDSDFFLFSTRQFFGNNASVSTRRTTKLSSWFIHSAGANSLLVLLRDILYDIQRSGIKIKDYFVFHFVLREIVSKRYPEIWWDMLPVCGDNSFAMCTVLFDEYDELKYNVIKENTFIHKFTYKYPQEMYDRPDTLYKKLLEKEYDIGSHV